MRGAIVWIAKYGDELAAIVLALAVAALAWSDAVGTVAVGNTILLVLAAITTSNLRDRFHGRTLHKELLTKLDAEAQVRVLTGSQLADALAAARDGTVVWLFRGGTGTYLRAVTLPECVRTARLNRRRLEVKIQIIDPTDAAVCGRYARFRNTLAPHPDGTGEIWTMDRTRKEAYATILAACWHRQRYDLLEIAVGLSTTMSTFRWDLSSNAVILTQEDAAGQALLFNSGKIYYDYWDIELRNSFGQARAVPIQEASDMPLSDEPSVDEVIALFELLGLALPGSYEPRDVSDIVAKAIQARNPYER